MIKKEQLYEGKAKKVFATKDPELLIVSYKDDATAFNGLKKGTIVGKGVINNRMSNLLMIPQNSGMALTLWNLVMRFTGRMWSNTYWRGSA